MPLRSAMPGYGCIAGNCGEVSSGSPGSALTMRTRTSYQAAWPVTGSEFDLAAGMVVIALGTSANPLVQSTTPDLATNRRGYITADPETLRTSKRGVFAAGDIVTGAATVILAMAAGRKAAGSIAAYLDTNTWE